MTTLAASSDGVSPPRLSAKRWWVAASVCGIIGLVAIASWWLLRPHLPAYIVYDAQASAAKSLADMNCAPQIRTECQKPVIDGELSFRTALVLAHDELPNCRGVFFIIDNPATNSPQTIDRLAQARRRLYWQLRVADHIGRDGQESTLQRSDEISRGIAEWGGTADARATMDHACQIGRDGGVSNGW